MDYRKFRALRIELRISMQSLANRFGMTKESVCGYETGRVANPRWPVEAAWEHMLKVQAFRKQEIAA